MKKEKKLIRCTCGAYDSTDAHKLADSPPVCRSSCALVRHRRESFVIAFGALPSVIRLKRAGKKLPEVRNGRRRRARTIRRRAGLQAAA